MTQPFVHLHTHTYYSLLDGANPIEELAERAKAFGMPAVAMTDHGNLFGAIEFYQTMKAAGIKPIIGCEIYLLTKGSLHDRDTRTGEGFLSHLTVLARNNEGYKNLCRLISIAHLEGFYYKPRLDKTTLAAHSDGLIALTGCLNGEISRHLQNDDLHNAKQMMEWLLRTFGEESIFVEMMRNGLPIQDKVNDGLQNLARLYARPVVATNDCHYGEQGTAAAHDALLCIQTGKNIADEKRMKMDTDQFYFRSGEEMAQIFADVPEAVTQSAKIAELCNVEFDLDSYHFPKFDAPEGQTLDDVLRERTLEGFAKRWPLIERQRKTMTAAIRQEYETRLTEELECITKMGFAGYFLIVADFIQFAKNHGIPVGPGRGSAAGSLVAYSLDITDIDPLPFGLFFERFLNPERISMPDMDIDFCMRRRDEVIQYVQQKYGNVGQIITFGKMKAKAVIRDVARVMGISYGDADRLAKLIPNTLGITLDEAIEQEPRIREMAKQDPQIETLLTTARALEGFPRHASTHAAGVVISDKPLSEFLPLAKGTNGETVTQFDMKGVETIGLIKFDFLGLKTLTILHDAIDILVQQGKPRINLTELPFDDPQVFAMLSEGDTAAVFQLESSGMTDLVIRLKPSVFEDIVALVALFRPGPLGSGMVDDFINRKHGRTKILYPLPQLEPILRDSYGVILYQEQVMQIASVLANYSMGEADLLRRAMGKKKAEEMAQQKERFLQGASHNKIDPRKAEQIFDLMEKFAGYGFNKAHSVAYALIAYHTAYFKTHHPTEFFAATLTNEMGNTDKILQYLTDAKAHDIVVLPPDVNACEEAFKVVGEKQIRFGLAAVKNVGENAIASIVAARAEGPYQDLFDFCDRVDMRRVNRRVIESLIKCGAFDSLGEERGTVWAAIDHAMEYGASRQRERESGQENLFAALAGGQVERPKYAPQPIWPENQRLAGEKEILGFYITGHPLSQYRSLLATINSHRTDTLIKAGDKRPVRLGGVVAALREITTKRGDRMGFVTLEDLHGTVEVVVFSEAYAKRRTILQNDQPIFVLGTTDINEESVKIICEDIWPLEEAPQQVTRSVHFALQSAQTAPALLDQLQGVLQQYRGVVPAFLHVVIPDQTETVMRLSDDFRLLPSVELVNAVNDLFGAEVTRFEL